MPFISRYTYAIKSLNNQEYIVKTVAFDDGLEAWSIVYIHRVQERVIRLDAHLFLITFEGFKPIHSNKERWETGPVIRVSHIKGFGKQGLKNKVPPHF